MTRAEKLREERIGEKEEREERDVKRDTILFRVCAQERKKFAHARKRKREAVQCWKTR